jgi:hypothetical protein
MNPAAGCVYESFHVSVNPILGIPDVAVCVVVDETLIRVVDFFVLLCEFHEGIMNLLSEFHLTTVRIYPRIKGCSKVFKEPAFNGSAFFFLVIKAIQLDDFYSGIHFGDETLINWFFLVLNGTTHSDWYTDKHIKRDASSRYEALADITKLLLSNIWPVP